MTLRISPDRLLLRLRQMGRIGLAGPSGISRLTLDDGDRHARDLFCAWCRALGLELSVDLVGNLWALRPGARPGPPVVIGGHLETDRLGSPPEAAIGPLAGLEVLATLAADGRPLPRALAVALFTGTEGTRFAPALLGAGVQSGAIAAREALGARSHDGATVLAAALEQAGYRGPHAPRSLRPAAYLELVASPAEDPAPAGLSVVSGLEGMVLDAFTLGPAAGVAGAQAAAGPGAAAIARLARSMAQGHRSGTQLRIGPIELFETPASGTGQRARLSVELRDDDAARLDRRARLLAETAHRIARHTGLELTHRPLLRQTPVALDPALMLRIERLARARRLPLARGAIRGPRALAMFAPLCPTGAILVPLRPGPATPDLLVEGAQLLLETAVDLACTLP